MVAEETLTLRTASTRGTTKTDWLYGRHSFSFGGYYDPRWMGFRCLRVINDDVIAPGNGFGMHGHRDMEIITVVLSGELQHRDSLGNGAVLRPGEVQVMTAGSGIRHSEFNPSSDKPVHLLQIWIEPHSAGLPPSYAQKRFEAEHRHNQWSRVAGPVGDDGALVIAQDAHVFIASISAGTSLQRPIGANRAAWVHVASGEITLNGQTLREGDAVGLEGAQGIQVVCVQQAEVLLFDL